MKNKFSKGFTLIECLIALALFGIASLTMAQIYAQVGLMNKANHINNTSLAYQMKLVESYLDADSIKIEYDTATYNATSKKAPHHVSSDNDYVTIQRKSDDPALPSTYDTYSYGVDTFVLLSRNTNDVAYDADKDRPDNLRYKYFIGHKPT